LVGGPAQPFRNGIRVTDVWETREQSERFAQNQITPYAREAGFPGEPEIRFHEVHNYLTQARKRRERGFTRARSLSLPSSNVGSPPATASDIGNAATL
jgi:hypothetical protein